MNKFNINILIKHTDQYLTNKMDKLILYDQKYHDKIQKFEFLISSRKSNEITLNDVPNIDKLPILGVLDICCRYKCDDIFDELLKKALNKKNHDLFQFYENYPKSTGALMLCFIYITADNSYEYGFKSCIKHANLIENFTECKKYMFKSIKSRKIFEIYANHCGFETCCSMFLNHDIFIYIMQSNNYGKIQQQDYKKYIINQHIKYSKEADRDIFIELFMNTLKYYKSYLPYLIILCEDNHLIYNLDNKHNIIELLVENNIDPYIIFYIRNTDFVFNALKYLLQNNIINADDILSNKIITDNYFISYKHDIDKCVFVASRMTGDEFMREINKHACSLIFEYILIKQYKCNNKLLGETFDFIKKNNPIAIMHYSKFLTESLRISLRISLSDCLKKIISNGEKYTISTDTVCLEMSDKSHPCILNEHDINQSVICISDNIDQIVKYKSLKMIIINLLEIFLKN